MDSSEDEVARIVAAWRRERPDLDVRPLEVLSRVSRLARHLDIARRKAFAASELESWEFDVLSAQGREHVESWEFDVLSALRRQGAPYQLSPGKLLKETLVTSGTMTNRIDRLVKKGLVERLPLPGDRRGVLVRLRTAGQQREDAAQSELLAREEEILAALGDKSQGELAELLRQVLVPFDAEPGA